MKIGIEGQRLFRKKKHGMDIVALETIKELQKVDTENEYFIFVKEDEDYNCLHETSNFKIVKVPGNNYFTWEQINLSKYVKKYGVDLLHCTSNTAPLVCPVPLILTLHDVIFLQNQLSVPNTSTLYQRAGNYYRKLIVPRIVQNAYKIITVSHTEKKYILDITQLPENAVEVIYNGVHPRFSQHISEGLVSEVNQKFDFPAHYFFFLGNTDPKKNMLHVLEAFALFAEKYKDVNLIIADISEEQIKNMLLNIGKTYLLKRIGLPGYIPSQMLPVFYAKAKAFLYPSLRESFGLPILEAMACGTPVITSNISAMPEIAGEGALLVDPYNSNSIKDAMENTLLDTHRERLQINGIIQAKKFSWQKTAQQILSVYKNFQNTI